MPTLWIINSNAPEFMGVPSPLTLEDSTRSAPWSTPRCWFAKEGDALVLTAAVNPEFLSYVGQVMGYDAESLTILAPEDGEHWTLDFETMLHSPLFARLQELVREGDWRIAAFGLTRAVGRLAKALGCDPVHGPVDLVLNGNSEVLNSKTWFRRIAAALELPVPHGQIATTRAELHFAMHELLQVRGEVIVKQAFNADSDGNVYVGNTAAVKTGMRSQISLEGGRNLSSVAEELWERLITEMNTELVVEVYYDHTFTCYTEYELFFRARPRLLGAGVQTMAPVFSGFKIPGSLEPATMAALIEGSDKIVNLCAQLGQLGPIDIDGIITTEGELLFNEINARCGGCTHVHMIAETLLGEQYWTHHTVLLNNTAKARSFRTAHQSLRRADLLFASSKMEGVVLATDAGDGKIGCVTLARTSERARQIEQHALTVLSKAGA